jgi:hypothetical protein
MWINQKKEKNTRVWKHISPTRKDRVLIDKLIHGNG